MKRQALKHSKIASALIGAAFWGIALSTVSTQAITFGEPDGNAHPNVGAILRFFPDYGIVPGCSGTQIAPRVLLTAGHCAIYVEEHPEEEFFVSFNADNALDPSTWIRVVGAVTHPEFNTGHGAADSHQNDIGVLILEELVEGIEPAALPPLHYLDILKRERQLNADTLLTVVGSAYSDQLRPKEAIALYEEANAECRKALEIEPDRQEIHHSLAPLPVQSGDLDGYRLHRQTILALFAGTTD